MRKIISILVFFILTVSCNNLPGIADYADVPESSAISKKEGLLIAKYKPTQEEVDIDGEKYTIIDSWTTYRFKTKNSKVINSDIYEFLFSLKNKNGKLLTDKVPSNSFLNRSVRNLGKDFGYSNGIGIADGLLCIEYLKSKKPISPEFIVIEFRSGLQRQQIKFIKIQASH